MYVTTFYSFKGGVGRTLALANAAVELANRGRRVLAVDFDLEAPGLDAIKALRSKDATPGIVDFVQEYLRTSESPDVRDFVYRVPDIGSGEGGLWVMPAGSHSRDYGVRFRDIDWNELYARYDGYLLFEDLKAQWEAELKADWVFVDSRTGHTDTGGICTRQLPDAVVAVFFPNGQNLRGLERVVQDIRAEAQPPREKRIALHFAMSNVPDLDDEDAILEGHLREFRRKLAMRSDPLIIHRYDSLALLNQALFLRDRPRSRLAREYRDLVEAILQGNLEDRDGALLYVRDMSVRPWLWRSRRVSFRDNEANLEQIRETHDSDPEVLFELGQLFERQRRREEAAEVFDAAIDHGCEEPEALLFRSRYRADQGDTAEAASDARRVLQRESDDPWSIERALELAAGHSGVDDLVASRGVAGLHPTARLRVGTRLATNQAPEVRRVALAMLEPLSAHGLPDRYRRQLRSTLGMALISTGQFTRAEERLRAGRQLDQMGVQDSFNYGMAVWGATGDTDPEPFRRVLEQVSSSESEGSVRDPNFVQCLAVAQWASGDARAARATLGKAQRAMEAHRASAVSCWRYVEVSRRDFLSDLREIEALVSGDSSRKPHFMVEAPQAGSSEEADGQPRAG